MKTDLFLAFLPALLLAACSSGTALLTDEECKSIAHKEAVHLAAKFNKNNELSESLFRIAASRSVQCMQGSLFDRDDYDFAMSAKGDSEMDLCLREAADK